MAIKQRVDAHRSLAPLMVSCLHGDAPDAYVLLLRCVLDTFGLKIDVAVITLAMASGFAFDGSQVISAFCFVLPV